MAKQQSRKIVASLDIGTSKMLIVVAEVLDDRYEVLALEQAVSRGVESGILSDLGKATGVLKELLQRIEQRYDIRLNRIVTGVSGQHVEGMRRQVAISIEHEATPGAAVVQASHLEDLKSMVYKAITTSQRKILHTFFHNFCIDGNIHVQNPLGMVARKLSADCFMVTCSRSAYITILDLLGSVKLKCLGIALQQVGSAHAVLTEDEKRIGTCVIDIGAGTCDVCIYSEGRAIWAEVLPYAGDHITSDIAKVMHVPLAQAEKLKKAHGSCEPEAVNAQESIKIDDYYHSAYREIVSTDLALVIGSRVEETFAMIREKIEDAGMMSLLHGGVVLTGGGAHLTDIATTAARVFESMPVRIKGPLYSGRNRELVRGPEYATALGNLDFYLREATQVKMTRSEEKKTHVLGRFSNQIKEKYQSIQQWFG